MNTPFSTPAAPIPLKGLAVAARLEGCVFTCDVTQRYANESRETIEAIYTFPRAEDAVITAFSCTTAGERRTARLPTSRVSAAYLSPENGRAALLLEASADGTATLSIGRLAPGKTVEVACRTHALAAAQDGRLTLTVPLCSGRLAAGPGRPGPSLWADYPVQCDILLAGRRASSVIESASHDTETEETPDGLLVHFQNVRADGNVTLTLSGLPEENRLITAPDPFNPGCWCGVLLLTPPATKAEPAALDLDILADDSGSMAGGPCRASQEALAALTTLLTPEDRVKLTTYGTESWPAAPRSPFDDAFRQGAYLPAITSLGAGLGGSNTAQALKEALEATAAPRLGARRAVLLVTDGKDEDGEALRAAVKNASAPVFILGVGRTANAARLQSVAQATGGLAEFLLPGEDALPAVTRLIHAARRPPVPVAAAGALTDFLARCDWTSGFPQTVRPGLCHAVYFLSPVRPSLPVSWTANAGNEAKMTSLSAVTELADGGELAQTVAKKQLEMTGDAGLVRRYGLLDAESGLLLQADLAPAESDASRTLFVPEMMASEAVCCRSEPPRRYRKERPFVLEMRPSLHCKSEPRICLPGLSNVFVEDPVHNKAQPPSLLAMLEAKVRRRIPGKAPLPDQIPAWLEALFADLPTGALYPEDPAEKDAQAVQRWWTTLARRLPEPVRRRLCERLGAVLGGEDAPVLSIEILAAAALVKAAIVFYPTAATRPGDKPSPDALRRLADLERYCGQDFTPWFKDAFLRTTLFEAANA